MMENILKDYIDKLITYLEQDYELQDYIFVGYRIKYRIKKSVFNTTFILEFPNNFNYAFTVNLNVDDLPYINIIAIDIKYKLME